jgi:hypothetical protein
MFVGLVRTDGWEPPDDFPGPRPDRSWRVPWRALAWLAAFWALMGLVPVADHLLGAAAGFGVLMLAFTLGIWRIERWCAAQYWRGLRDYQA